ATRVPRSRTRMPASGPAGTFMATAIPRPSARCQGGPWRPARPRRAASHFCRWPWRACVAAGAERRHRSCYPPVAMRRRGRGQRGQAAILMALWLTGAFFALTVVGIDVGHLGTSATELQTVADIAAAAGARNLMKGGSASTAKSDATRVVAKNKVDGQSFTM